MRRHTEVSQPDQGSAEGVTEMSKKGGNKPKAEPKPPMVNKEPNKT